MEGVGVEAHVAAGGYFRSPLTGPRIFLEKFTHLLRRFDVELGIVGIAPLQVFEIAVEPDPDQYAVRERVLPPVKMAVIRGDQRYSGGIRQLNHALAYELFVGEAVILDFEEEAVFTQYFPIAFGS